MGKKVSDKQIKIYDEIRTLSSNLCYFCKRDVFKVCKRKEALYGGSTIHHKKPRRYGGGNNRDNLICICDECHNKLEILITCVEDAKSTALTGRKSNG